MKTPKSIHDINYIYTDLLIKHYLDNTNDGFANKLNKKKVILVVKKLREDLLKGHIDISVVSVVCHFLWTELINNSVNNPSLERFLYDSSEMAYNENKFLLKIAHSQDTTNDIYFDYVRDFFQSEL